MSKSDDVSSREALRQVREIVVKEKKRKATRKQIPIILDAIEILIALMERQDLR
jgi:hypothetical protein